MLLELLSRVKTSFDCSISLLFPPSSYIKIKIKLKLKFSPLGVSQSSSQSSGPLASFTTAGNLRRLSLNTDNQTGTWEIRVVSNNPYSVKVTGQ